MSGSGTEPASATDVARGDERLSMPRNFAWTTAGRLVFGASQWGILAVLAKTAEPALLGQYALASAICLPLITFSRLHLRSVLATDAQQQFSFRSYSRLTCLTTATALLILALLVLFTANARAIGLPIMAMGVILAAESFSELAYGLFQRREQMNLVGKSMMLRGVTVLLVLAATFALTRSLGWAMGAAALAAVAIVALYDYRAVASTRLFSDRRLSKPSRGDWRKSSLWPLARLAFPLGLITLITTLNVAIPRYIVDYYLGKQSLGIFSAMAGTLVAGNILVGGLCQAAIPRLARYWNCGRERDFRTLLIRIAAITGVAGTGGILLAIGAGRTILSLLYTADYATEGMAFTILSVAACVQYISNVFGAGVIAMRRFVLPLPVHLVCTVFILCSSIICVPWFGLCGAATVQLVGAIFPLLVFGSVTLTARSGHASD